LTTDNQIEAFTLLESLVVVPDELLEQLEAALTAYQPAALVTSSTIRRPARLMIENKRPVFPALSYLGVPSGTRLRGIGC